MTAGRSFQLATKAAVKEKRDAQYEPREYRFVTESGEEKVIVAHFPGEGALTLTIAATGAGDGEGQEADAVLAIFELLKESFSTEDYRYLRGLVRSEALDIELLMEMIEDMMEGWLAFPTQPSRASRRSVAPTGTRSTGRVRATTSTPQASLPVDS